MANKGRHSDSFSVAASPPLQSRACWRRYPSIEMLYIAMTKINNSKIKRLMINDYKDGVYLFLHDMICDGSLLGDYWFENSEAAFGSCKEDYGVDHGAWEQIPDQLEHCQQDWIELVRVVGRITKNPKWGRFEKLVDGKWIEIIKNKG